MPNHDQHYPVHVETHAGMIHSFNTAKGTYYMLSLRAGGCFVYESLSKAERQLALASRGALSTHHGGRSYA